MMNSVESICSRAKASVVKKALTFDLHALPHSYTDISFRTF